VSLIFSFLLLGAPARAQENPASAASTTALSVNSSDSQWEASQWQRLHRIHSSSAFAQKQKMRLFSSYSIKGMPNQGFTSIEIENETGRSYRLVKADVWINNEKVFSRVDDDGICSKNSKLLAYRGRLIPGKHQVSVRFVLQGNGFGLFSYMKSYMIGLKAGQNFTSSLSGNKHLLLKIKENILKPMDKRFSISITQ
jgi:hypothetical protein